jgi:hypothetical protein
LATVELRFTALPEHVRTARLVAVSLARRAGVDEETLDEVRLAVGEAASRAVGRHRASRPGVPVLVRMTDGDGRFVAEVVDVAGELDGADDDAGGSPAVPSPSHPATASGRTEEYPDDAGDSLDDLLPPGVDLAVIGGLVDDVEIKTGVDGSVVRMAWPAVDQGRNSPSAFGTPITSA